MAKKTLLTIKGKSHSMKKQLITIGGTYRKVKKVLLTTNGVYKVVFPNFPSQPSDYELIATYTEYTVFEAPENGWYQIELCGASGNGGLSDTHDWKYSNDHYDYRGATGGGGGGGAVAISRVKLNAGDKVIISPSAVGDTSTVTINTTVEGESYAKMTATSGANGTDGQATPWDGATANEYFVAGTGGIGGTASGGNHANYNGGEGGNGRKDSMDSDDGYDDSDLNVSGGAGGTAGNANGNTGAKGRDIVEGRVSTINYGKAGFVNIYAGNTN